MLQICKNITDFHKKKSMITGNTIVKGHENNGKLEATLMSKETLSRRTLDRFRRSNPSNHLCWDRNPDKDSFFNVIDTHNHFRPFGGPPVPFDTYLQWMKDAGILFSTMFGIGQKIVKKHQSGRFDRFFPWSFFFLFWKCYHILRIPLSR